jgi:hypothetical protein
MNCRDPFRTPSPASPMSEAPLAAGLRPRNCGWTSGDSKTASTCYARSQPLRAERSRSNATSGTGGRCDVAVDDKGIVKEWP